MAALQQISGYYLVPEDLTGLDKSTLEGLQPLLEALNRTLGQMTQVVNTQPQRQVLTMTLKVLSSLSSVFPLQFKTTVSRPQSVQLGACRPADPAHSLAIPFVPQNWSITDKGLISIPVITGILPSNTYVLTLVIE